MGVEPTSREAPVPKTGVFAIFTTSPKKECTSTDVVSLRDPDAVPSQSAITFPALGMSTLHRWTQMDLNHRGGVTSSVLQTDAFSQTLPYVHSSSLVESLVTAVTHYLLPADFIIESTGRDEAEHLRGFEPPQTLVRSQVHYPLCYRCLKHGFQLLRFTIALEAVIL